MALTNNLLAFYKLDNTTDSSGNGNTLTNNGNVTFASGKLGNAAVFDGSNYLQATDSNLPSGQSSRTISCWYKTTSNSEVNVLAYGAQSFNGGVVLYSQNDGKFIFSQYGDGIISTSSLNDNNWHNIVVTYDGTNWILYVDGSINDQKAMGTDTQLTELLIGGAWGGGGNFDGSVDAVGIWNRALSDAEVAELYNNGTGLELEVPNLNNGLQAFYKLSDLTDSSGNNRTLTNNGNVSFASGKLGNAAVFDGSNCLTGESLLVGNTFSVAGWVNNKSNDQCGIVYQNTGFGISILGGVIELTDLRSFGEYTTSQIPQNIWNHFAVSVNNGFAKVFVNGALELEVTNPSNVVDLNGDGGLGIGGNGSFVGGTKEMDAVGIWNRALSDAEVAELYNNGNGLELGTTPTLNTLTKIQGNAKFYGKVKFGV
jgi:hypothetical protein